MTKLQRLKEEASSLSYRQKEELMEHIVQSVAQDFEPSVKAAWIKEIKRRDADVRSGKSKLIPHEKVMADLRRALR
jgi:putative addiction module component (TIGR02574 family)